MFDGRAVEREADRRIARLDVVARRTLAEFEERTEVGGVSGGKIQERVELVDSRWSPAVKNEPALEVHFERLLHVVGDRLEVAVMFEDQPRGLDVVPTALAALGFPKLDGADATGRTASERVSLMAVS